MIKENRIIVKISSSNFKHYENKYGPFRKNDLIDIDINDLQANSAIKITAICDICGIEKKVKYQNYIKQYKNGNFYSCFDCKHRKTIETNIKKYGKEHHLQNKDILKKQIDTLKIKYNITNISQLDEIREKRRLRLKDKKYQIKMKEGVIKSFNIDNVSKLDNIKEKKEITLISNYGVRNPSQSPDIFFKSQKNGKKIKKHENLNIYYRGSYEKDFLDICYNYGITVEKGKTIKYVLNNKEKFYHSDFYIREKNLIIEIKSIYYYNKYKKMNMKKKEYCLKNGYKYMIIIDKNYDEFLYLMVHS